VHGNWRTVGRLGLAGPARRSAGRPVEDGAWGSTSWGTTTWEGVVGLVRMAARVGAYAVGHAQRLWLGAYLVAGLSNRPHSIHLGLVGARLPRPCMARQMPCSRAGSVA